MKVQGIIYLDFAFTCHDDAVALRPGDIPSSVSTLEILARASQIQSSALVYAVQAEKKRKKCRHLLRCILLSVDVAEPIRGGFSGN